MKRTLFFSVVALVFSFINTNAQTVWNFSNWDVTAGYSANTVVNNLAIIQGENITTMGQVEANTANFSDGFSATKRFKLNGGSYETGATNFVMPTKRYIFFNANGNCSIKIWYKNGGGGDRTLYVTNGTSIIASNTYSNSTDGLIYTADYTGPATNIYIAGDQALNIYKIEITGSVGTTTLAVGDIKKNMKTNAFSAGNKVYVSNVSKNTEVNVYSSTGALVKTLKTSSDLNFELNNTGIYIVNLKSDEGIKSVKVLVK